MSYSRENSDFIKDKVGRFYFIEKVESFYNLSSVEGALRYAKHHLDHNKSENTINFLYRLLKGDMYQFPLTIKEGLCERNFVKSFKENMITAKQPGECIDLFKNELMQLTYALMRKHNKVTDNYTGLQFSKKNRQLIFIRDNIQNLQNQLGDLVKIKYEVVETSSVDYKVPLNIGESPVTLFRVNDDFEIVEMKNNELDDIKFMHNQTIELIYRSEAISVAGYFDLRFGFDSTRDQYDFRELKNIFLSKYDAQNFLAEKIRKTEIKIKEAKETYDF